MPKDEDNGVAQLEIHDHVGSEEVENQDVISERSPSIDSITHPYRSFLEDTSFPRCHLTGTPAGNTETYSRSMLMLGNGLPIWDPLGNIKRPQKHIKSGVSIGDVGVLDNEGDFVCFFNVFLPPTDEVHRMCPPDMIPFHPAPGPSDIATDAGHFPPGTTLVSESFESTQLSASPLHIDFKIKAREGSILILPNGASREDLISTTRLREYVQQHALSWYTFINKRTRPDINIPNGSLCVVTGCDKAVSWAIAATATQGHKASEYPLSITYRGDDSPPWDSNSRIRCKSTKTVDPSQKYSVFIRGMKIAVSISDWTNHVLHNEPPTKVPFYNLLVIPNTGIRARYQTFIERRRGFPSQYLSPFTRFVFHPSDVLLRYLLQECPGSEVAIVEDAMLTENYKTLSDGCGPEVVNFLLQVLIADDIHYKDGLATLIPRPLEQHQPSYIQQYSSLFSIPSLLKQWYQDRRQRKMIAGKLHRIFPGLPVPPDDLTQGY